MTAAPQGDEREGAWVRWRSLLLGKPRDLNDAKLFHQLSLIPFLAWVGLGADGLSSSSYGPEEAFKTLGQHTYLALGLALLTAVTVLVISAAYSRIIEQFPHGGGGYVVATKLLGKRAGVVSGCALLVDYVLTITVSIAAAGDALFSFVPPEWHGLKLIVEAALVCGLTTLNVRGVKESVMALSPIFVLFLVTHVVMIGYGIGAHLPQVPETVQAARAGFSADATAMGLGSMLLLFIHAYSLGGGTYTGIEAVSNGLMIMRAPRVATAKRTMIYMGISLALTAGGLLVCYLLWHVQHADGKTMNAVLLETLTARMPGGRLFTVVTLLTEGALLVVAAQAGFLDGPRVLANMANDSWMPRRFGAVSDRLTTVNGILLMGGAALAALLYSQGRVDLLVVMYSINVFLTFFLSMFGMARFCLGQRRGGRPWIGRFALFALGTVMCACILVITILEKFLEGGWVTIVATGSLILLCFWIRRKYLVASKMLSRVYAEVSLTALARQAPAAPAALDPAAATAVVLVASYSGLGIHTVQTILSTFPGLYRNLIFVTIGVIDSGGFTSAEDVVQLRERTEETLARYVKLAERLGVAGSGRFAIGTDASAEAEKVCLEIGRVYGRATFFAGKIVFEKEHWYQRLLHNETALGIQKRLLLAGHTMVVLPARVG